MTETDKPFEEIVISMNEEGQKQSYLGLLETYPHLYEFTLTEETVLQAQTRQRAEEGAYPVNLILVSVHPDTYSISEVARLNSPISERTEDFVESLGISVYESEWLEIELEPGLYRLEVSTPRNEDPYELNFGIDSVNNSYFGTFTTVWKVQHHFKYNWTQYFRSTYVLYQIGIIILLGGFFYVIKMRKKRNADTAA